MGIIIAKFRKKKTTFEVLDKLENEIKSIEEYSRDTEQTQRKMVGRFIFLSICVYCITALILYFYFFPASLYERIYYMVPLIIFPILLVLIKRILSWYYTRKISKNHKKLATLKDEKKKILEEVMDKETYKVAKKILEKFAPDQVKKNTGVLENTPIRTPLTSLATSIVPTPGLRYRGAPSATQLNRLQFGGPTPSIPRPMGSNITPGTVVRSSGTPLPLPRAVLPRDRSALDKMVDYLVGDGPNNRYALICKNCSSHNGMALREEFDYLSFRCCYCMAFNSARKKRPVAPKLEDRLMIKNKASDASDSDSGDLDSDEGPIIELPPEGADGDKNEEGKLSDFEKISDVEIKSSDTESSAMDVDLNEEKLNEIELDHRLVNEENEAMAEVENVEGDVLKPDREISDLQKDC